VTKIHVFGIPEVEWLLKAKGKGKDRSQQIGEME
jgi:hypothetical protein